MKRIFYSVRNPSRNEQKNDVTEQPPRQCAKIRRVNSSLLTTSTSSSERHDFSVRQAIKKVASALVYYKHRRIWFDFCQRRWCMNYAHSNGAVGCRMSDDRYRITVLIKSFRETRSTTASSRNLHAPSWRQLDVAAGEKLELLFHTFDLPNGLFAD